MVKREFIFLFVLVFSAGFVFGCTDADRILRLSSTTNAHGALYTGAYGTEICYSDIFGEVYDSVAGGFLAHPISCDPAGEVLRLSSTTNAHAEKPEASAYSTLVCYGDLSCRVVNGDCTSSDGEKMIVSLSSETNAHLSKDADYSYKICCVSPSFSTSCSEDAGAIQTGGVWNEIACDDGNDNDCDDLVDCDDNDCVSNVDCLAVEINCADGNDNDADGKTDCLDTDCNGKACVGGGTCNAAGSCVVAPVACSVDSNSDGNHNCLDADCPCGAGKTCNAAGTCVVVCINECDVAGKSCSGNSVVSCENTDADSCLEKSVSVCDNFKICSAGSCNKVIYWANSIGQKITSADFGDTVWMIANNTNFADGDKDFDIYEIDGLLWNSIRTNVGKVSSGNAIADWTIVQADLDKTSDYGEFDFEFASAGINAKSDYLSINTIPLNEEPVITINVPCGKEFAEGAVFDIEVSLTDLDDIVSGGLYVDGVFVKDLASGVTVVPYTFDEAGSILVRVNATDGRGGYAEVSTTVLVVNSAVQKSYLAACIGAPENLKNFGSGLGIEFDARNTIGIYFKADGSRCNLNDMNYFNFYWTFSSGASAPVSDGSNSLASHFWKTFPEAGRQSASLEVEMDMTAVNSCLSI